MILVLEMFVNEFTVLTNVPDGMLVVAVVVHLVRGVSSGGCICAILSCMTTDIIWQGCGVQSVMKKG